MKIKNGMSYEKNGWKYVSIKGKPKERGYAYGYLCADDFKEIQKMLTFVIMESYGMEWNHFIKENNLIHLVFQSCTRKLLYISNVIIYII